MYFLKLLQVLKTDAEELVSRSYWDTLRRNTSQALFSDLAEVQLNLKQDVVLFAVLYIWSSFHFRVTMMKPAIILYFPFSPVKQ